MTQSTGTELKEKLEMLRSQGVKEFTCPEFTVQFSERAYLSHPMSDNFPKPENAPPSKRDEAKEDDSILFHSTPFVGG
jgi:hypothetical protein